MTNLSSPTFLRIPFSEMESEFFRILVRCGVNTKKAKATSAIFMNNSLEGVYTHGVNRFAKFVQLVQNGYIKFNSDPVCKSKLGAVEQWDGQSGIGVTNALKCTERAMELAKEYGIGCVALANTNHWMRGGTYGWKAAKAGFAFIGWTNTISNTPTWGAKDARLGNNPLVIAVPFQDEAIVLDMAMSQFSYGAMELHKLKGEKLAVPGGYDKDGKLSDEPDAILQSRRTLPVGYWKGAGLSLLLDILATTLSGGLSVSEISKQSAETNLSQVFIVVNLSGLAHHQRIAALLQQIIEDYQNSIPLESTGTIRYPGERMLQVRAENSEKGIPVLQQVWEEIKGL